jgi:hypothetical protein
MLFGMDLAPELGVIGRAGMSGSKRQTHEKRMINGAAHDLRHQYARRGGAGMIEVAIRDELVQIRLLLELILQGIESSTTRFQRVA